METIQTQALVIGAGPGGYPCGIRLGQLKVPTIVVEKYKPGGVCLNVGCIPSKALINAAKRFDQMRHGEDMGLSCDNPRVDMGKLVDWKDEVVGKLTSGVKQLLKANGAEYRQGEVTFVSPHEVEVKDAKSGTTYRIQAKAIVIATGSRPIEVPGFKFDEQRILSSTGALAIREIPQRLVVIGGGYIGLELGMCYAKLGSKVAVVEMMPSLLPGTDPDLVQVVARKMKKLGIESFLEAKAKSDDGKAVTIQTKDGKEVRLDADKVLVTVGRKPNVDGLGLEKIGVKIEKGFIKVDERMRTNVEGVYAIGDVAGQPMLAHKATKEGEVAAEVIAGHAAAMDVRAIPAVIFTDPEIAYAGMMEPDAKAAGKNIKVGKFPMAALGRALSIGETDGFVKVVLEAETKEVLGLAVVGAGASDLISEAALALEMGALAEDIGLTVHPHPTLPEAIMEASKAALGEAIHIVNR
jgi:dihydrolipoamide dehydrogenase